MHLTEEQLGNLIIAVEKPDQDVSQVTMEWMNEKEELGVIAGYSKTQKR